MKSKLSYFIIIAVAVLLLFLMSYAMDSSKPEHEHHDGCCKMIYDQGSVVDLQS